MVARVVCKEQNGIYANETRYRYLSRKSFLKILTKLGIAIDVNSGLNGRISP